ncbi:MAG: alpha/beta hydrolase [Paracoccaceae bacterium]
MTYISHREPGQPDRPVILALHGTGGDEHQFTALIHRMVPGAGIVAPRGDVSEYGANRFFRRTGEGVYDMDDLARRTGAMLDFVAGVRADTPGRPLYAFGYSNGANILAAMLFQRPQLFDRAALLHPLIPWQPAPQPGLRDLPVLVSAGRSDPICPLPQSQALIDWLGRQGAQVESLIESGGHEIRPAEVAALQGFLRGELPLA